MVDISFEINGRKVSPNSMGNVLEAAALSAITDSIKKQAGSIRCPEHGQAPKIKVKGRNLNNLSFEVSGCCDNLIIMVKEKLK